MMGRRRRINVSASIPFVYLKISDVRDVGARPFLIDGNANGEFALKESMPRHSLPLDMDTCFKELDDWDLVPPTGVIAGISAPQ